MDTLGERIKKLRKSRKLTLETLAGDVLTKGMLSLIENNKANPSMESLAYIAEQLDVSVSSLLEEVSNEELRKLVTKVESLFYTPFEQMTNEYEKMIHLIEPYLPHLNEGYESARLLEIYGRSLHSEKRENWQKYLDRAASLYEQLNILDRRAYIGMVRANIEFSKHNYEKALKILQKERAEIEEKISFMNPIVRLDFDFMESTFYFAVGNFEKALKIMEGGIAFSREEKIFYKIDDLYRLATYYAFMFDDEKQFNYYVKKIKQYGEFTEDPFSLMFVKLIHIEVLNSKEKDYNRAIQLLERDKHHFINDRRKIFQTFYYLEKGKALRGIGKYKEAIKAFEKISIPKYLNHPFDLVVLYEGDALRALCYLALGDIESAKKYIQIAYDRVISMPSLPPKHFVVDTYHSIIKQ